MLQRFVCLKNLAPEVRNMGEDPNDVGGYFIIDGRKSDCFTRKVC